MSKKILFSFLASALFLSGCAAPAKIQKIINAATESEVARGPSESAVAPATSDKPATPETNTATDTLAVTWQKPEKIPSLRLFIDKAPADNGQKGVYAGHDEASGVTYYTVGKTTYNNVPATVVAAVAAPIDMGSVDYIFFLKTAGSLFLLSQHTYEQNFSQLDKATQLNLPALGLNTGKFILDTATRLKGLDFTKILQKDTPRQTLIYRGAVWFDQQFPLQKVFEIQGQDVFTNTSTNAFYLKSLTPLQPLYVVELDFFDKDNLVPQITWANGEKNTGEYSYVSRGGCGSSDYLQVVDSKDINVSTDLVVVGKNNQGDPIYELKDANHQWLKNVYNDFPVEPRLTYEQFLAARPLLYWVDPFGRLVELQNNKFQPQAECGKPVIYLYPKKTMNVSVNVKPQGGLTYSEPKLNDGWEVEAQPNGDLTETKTGRYYPYLFWEGRGDIYEQPKLGWVVKRASVKQFLVTKLTQLGLKRPESNDFLDFWLPKMQEKPYYFITFLGNAMMDKLAPLTVIPAPDTVIRILMDFTPLDAPIATKGFTIRTPKRTGFTVVEWGGVVR
ncbi:MAG: hypothetical protein HY983_04295 [Candidatus Magasanikbacteria bacterium]|nr:hypothetical protein [Candidatus Magasanikbacteria bacterium]